MTDLIFLLLIFFVCTSTLVNPNALRLLLPQSSNQTATRPHTSVSIDRNLNFFVETRPVAFDDLERQLQLRLMNEPNPAISIHVDGTIPVDELVRVLNIAARNGWRPILATRPERR